MTDSQALPSFFETMLAGQYSAEDAGRILAGCRVRRKTTLRANTLVSSRDVVARRLEDEGVGWAPVSWYSDAFIIADDAVARVRSLDVYENGSVYLQSLSSMMPALALNAQPGEDVCDMCAAPGGKTTQIAALTQGQAYVTACEMHAPRAEKLEYNLRKLGARNVTVMRTDARRLDDFFSFDRILIDAPCSGSGTLFAGDSKLPKRFTPALVEKVQRSQRALLAKGLKLLKPGGTLVYSTCSVLACENEDIVSAALRDAKRAAAYEVKPIGMFNGNDVPMLPTSLEGAVVICPTELYEGFFMAKIKRVE